MEIEQIVRLAKCQLWLGEDGIVRIVWIPGAEVTLENAQETMAAYLKVNQGKRRPLFVDTKSMRSLARGARTYYASEYAAQIASAVAIIIGSPVSKVLGNFYLGVSNPHLPTRLFSSEEQALEWLKEYIE